jgi:hypothetical protein
MPLSLKFAIHPTLGSTVYMPRISDAYTHIAAYIYASAEDAEEGRAVGGSGFLVHVAFETNKHLSQIYVVTNRHVILRTPTPVIRLNQADGSLGGFITNREDWTLHPAGDDVAVLPVKLRRDQMTFKSLGMELFVTPQIIHDEDIGIGDDTIMVGRFVGHDGKQKNTPSVRFGNIAMMPGDKIVTADGFAQESFLVELRSLPGYSGSPVFIYSPNAERDMSIRRAGTDMAPLSNFNLFGPNAQESIDLMMKKITPKGPYLLGIDWSHLNNHAPVWTQLHQTHPEGLFVRENAGMAGVVPAWKIAEVLNVDTLMQSRRMVDEKLSGV